MKSTIKTVFAAVAAMFAATTARAADVIEVIPCGSAYPYADNVSYPVNTPDTAYTSGEDIYFKVRLLNKAVNVPWTISDPTNTIAWSNNPIKIGIYAGGTNTFADLVYWGEVKDGSDDSYITDFVFKYTTQVGDFALPVVLLGTSSGSSPIPLNFFTSGTATQIYFDPSSSFKIVSSGDSSEAVFQRIDDLNSTPVGVGALSLLGHSQQSITLETAAINVKTVNFDTHADSDAIWRTVKQGSTELTSAYEPTLMLLDGLATSTQLNRFYVWSADESQIYLTGDNVETVNVETNSGVYATFNIATVEIPAGTSESSGFKIAAKSDATIGGTAKLMMSSWKGFQLNQAGSTIMTNLYLTATVAVTNPPVPTVKVSFSNTKVDAAETLEEDGSYKATLTAMTVTVEPAYATDVDVSLTAGYADSGDTLPTGVTDFGSYIRFVDASAFNNDAGDGVLSYAGLDYEFASLTIPAGGSVTKQVIVLRSDNTVSGSGHGLKMTPALINTSLTDIQVGAAASLRITASSPTLGSLYVGGEEISLSSNSVTTIDAIAGTQYSIQLTVPDNGDTPADIGGVYELWVKTNQTQAAWSFVTNLVRNTGADGQLELDDGTGASSGDLPTIAYSDNLASQTTQLKLVSPVSGQSATAKFIVNVEAGPNPTGAFYSDSALTTAITELDEGGTAYFSGTVSNLTDTTTYYAYLIVTNYSGVTLTTNLFDEAGNEFIVSPNTDKETTAGLAVNKSGTTGTFAAPGAFAILDGSDKYLEFTAVLCTSAKYDPTKVVYRGTTPTRLMINNIAPDVSGQRLQMFSVTGTTTNTFGYATTNAAFSATLPTDTKRYFRFDASRLANLDVALDLNNAKTTWNVIPPADSNLDSFYEDPVTYVGNPADAVLALTNDVAFAASGLWTITATVTDKDGATSEAFTAYVNVIDENARNLYVDFDISSEGIQPTRYLNEPSGPAAGSSTELLFNVGLQYWDAAYTGSITARVDVVSNFTPEAGATNNIPQLKASNGVIISSSLAAASNSYFIVFTRANTSRTLQVVRDSLDGTAESYSDGYQVRASIVSDFVLPTGGQPANAFYNPAEDAALYLINSAPVPEMPEENAVSNAWNVAGGSATPISWRVTDAKLDFTSPWVDDGNSVTGIHIRVEGNNLINGTNMYVTATSGTASGTFKPDFGSNQGTGTVTFNFIDKDGTSGQSYTYYYYVRPSKFLTTANVGPGEGNEATGISSIYAAADGIGAGHLWVQDADYTRSAYWIMEWNCNTLEKPWVYAYPYAAGETDTTINTTGSGTAGKTYTTDCYTNPDGVLDSFFYGWILPSASDDTATYSLTVSPKYAEKLTRTQVQLPTALLEDGTGYAATHMEAIFSKEWRAADNMGDINADGIPDFFALSKSSYSGGVLQTADGTGAELASIATLNDDGDFYPSTGDLGSNVFAPGPTNTWSTKGQPFTAVTEIRGLHIGLNYGMFKADKKEMQDGWVSDVELSYEEKLYLINSLLASADGTKWAGASYEAIEVTNHYVTTAYADLNEWLEPVAPGDAGYPAYTNSQKLVKAYINATWAGYASGDGADKWGFTVENRTDPTLADTDGDGMDDGYEYYFWYAATVGFTNKNGVAEQIVGSRFNIADIESPEDITSAKIASLFNPNEKVDWTKQDTDNDGLLDVEEMLIGTSPILWDSDGDHLSDLYEVMYNINPLSVLSNDGSYGNTDNDYMAYGTMDDSYFVYTDTSGNLWALVDRLTLDANGTSATTNIVTTGFQVAKFLGGNSIAGGSTYIPTTEWTKKEYLESQPISFTVETNAAPMYTEIALCHHQVYNYFGFDPRTARIHTSGTVARWKDNPAGRSVHTTSFSNLDEFRLMKYRYIVGLASASNDIKDIKDEKTTVAQVVAARTTNPTPPFDEKQWGSGNNTYSQTQHGQDTDGDAVPDAWELYVGADPNIDFRIPRTVPGHDPLYWGNIYEDDKWYRTYEHTVTDADGNVPMLPNMGDGYEDGLNLAVEYAGTDSSIQVNTTCETVYANHPSQEGSAIYRWFNKFMPTDPRNDDTDGDGVADNEERADWTRPYSFNRWNQKAVARTVKHFSIYGEPYDNGEMVIAGGGLNPCSIDTDQDGLPDPWERQYGGILIHNFEVADGVFQPTGSEPPSAEDYDDIRAAIVAYYGTNTLWEAVSNRYAVIMGMDGTVADASSALGTSVHDVDWDGDGLENWQEYMVQAMRQFRYDDCRTPLLGRDIPKAETNGTGGITWQAGGWRGTGGFLKTSYMTPFTEGQLAAISNDLGYINFAGWANENPTYLSDLGYFSAPPKSWDICGDLGFMYMLPPKVYQDMVYTNIVQMAEVWTNELGEAQYLWDYKGRDDLVFTGTVWRALYNYDSESGEYTLANEDDKTNKVVYATRGSVSVPTAPYVLGTTTYWVEVTRKMRPVETNILIRATGGDSRIASYVGSDPRHWDTDRDGMDDYWELFHGLNPILGSVALRSASISQVNDIIYAANGKVSATYNAWTDSPWDDENLPTIDPIKYPWLMGAGEVDADGDGLRNENEALMANLASPNTYHTDPSPLWMTDTSVETWTNAVFESNTVVTNKYPTDVYEFVGGVLVPITRDVVTTNIVSGVPLNMVGSPSYVALFYENEIATDYTIKEVVSDDLSTTNYITLAAMRAAWNCVDRDYVFSFEENEGYDTDNDFRSDSTELYKVVESTSDPLDFSDVPRRQSLYFGGDAKPGAAICFTPQQRNRNANDLLKQFTVETWVRPEERPGHDQYLVSRASNYGAWDMNSPTNLPVVRMNFALGIDKDGYLFGEIEDNAETSARVRSLTVVPTNAWTHIAATYDGASFKIYVNGVYQTFLATDIIPANGVSQVEQDPQGQSTFPVNAYASRPSTTILGARACGSAAFSMALAATNAWDNIATDFFKGSLSEVRVWDGARSAPQIESAYKTRFTADYIKTLKEEAYLQYFRGYTRNDTIPATTKSPELLQHYSFSTLPGATDYNYVQKVPPAFATNVISTVRNPDNGAILADMIQVGWWTRLATNSSINGDLVYNSKHVVPWIENTVYHLPRLSGLVKDSVYWSENFAGYTPATWHSLEKYSFPNSMNPYNVYYTYYEDTRAWSKLDWCAVADPSYNDYLSRFLYDTYYEFTATSDLVPMGHVYAKRLAESWDGEGPEDAWAITTDGTSDDGDPTGNGIPTWATNQFGTVELYTRALSQGFMYGASGAYKDDDFDIRAAKQDVDGNGIPDWWESLYGVEGFAAGDDPDNDGLSNYAEYLVGEDPLYGDGTNKNGWASLNPLSPRSSENQQVRDYFLPGGTGKTGYYLGELFTDHDMIENWWESMFDSSYTSVDVYDPNDDRDGDGWSNFAEARASMWNGGYLANIIDRYLANSVHEESYPKPSIGVRIAYNGNQDVSGAPLVMRVYNGKSSRVDATFKAQSGDYTAMRNDLGTYVGDTTLRGHLHPGRIIPGSDVQFLFRSLTGESTYHWTCSASAHGSLDTTVYGSQDDSEIWSGTETQYANHLQLHGSAVTLVDRVVEHTIFARTASDADGLYGTITTLATSNTTAVVIGNVDFLTGEYSIDIEKATDCGYNFAGSVLSVSYTYHIGDEWPQELWMSDPETGRVKEGLNTIEVFLDLDNDGVWDAGEPFGVVKNVNIGWAQTSLIDVEVTDVSPVVPRIAVTSGASDRFAIKGTGGMVVLTASENEENNDEEESVSGVTETYRIVRTKVNTTDMPSRAVVFSKTYVLDDRAYLHEGDVYTDKSFGLDWNTLSAAVHRVGIKMEEISSVTYALEKVSQNSDGSSETEEVLTFANTFGSQRAVASAAERIQNGIYKSSTPTFYWTSSDETMTAFKLQVFDTDTNEVYNSGIRKLPASQQGTYFFTPDDLHIGFAATNGAPVFADGTNYTWRVALLNPKFNSISDDKDAEGWSTPAGFKMQVKPVDGIVTGYGQAYATVRYFGPTNVAANAIIVAAYSTPDFTGAPLAMTRVTDVSMLADRTNLFESVSTNAVLKGIEPGNVYLMAFIDRNNNGKRDRYESWGYANKIDSATDFIYSPNPLSVSATGKTGSVVIYIEDTDINKNGILDVEEDLALLDAASSESTDPAVIASDNDLDGLVDTDEVELYGTDATQWDTDGDGMPDGWEQIFSGTDPLNADGDYAVYGDVMAYAVTNLSVIVTTNGTQYAEIDSETYYKTFDYNGTLALGAKTAAIAASEIESRRLENVIVVHGAVFDLFGYDSTTANMKALTLDETGSNIVYGVNTKPFTALDKYLVVRYFESFGLADEIAMNTNGTWRATTLKPGYYDSGSWSIGGLTPGTAGTAGTGIANGIPDGWELYARFADEADQTKTDEENKEDYDNDTNPIGDSSYLEGDVMAYKAIETPIYTVSDGTNTAKVASLAAEHIVGDLLSASNVYWSVYKYTTGVYGAGTNVAVTLGSAVSNWRVVAIDNESSLAFVHAQVYDLYGFNPNTANPNATEPVNTKVFTSRDKYLVKQYMAAIGITDWTNCTLSATTVDGNLDGIPDGWELYTMFGTNGVASAVGTAKGNLAISPWITPDDARTVLTNVITGAQLTLVEEYDKGNYPSDPWQLDTDGDGISDANAFKFHLKGDDGLLDADNDGLCNYAEYLLSKIFVIGKFDADNPYSLSAYNLDYFYKIGDMYAGEIFTDHDMMEDPWEDKQGLSYVSRYVWDPKSDKDEDGWSAFSEARYNQFTAGIVASKLSHMLNGAEALDMPVPAIALTVRYNGSQSLYLSAGDSSSSSATNLTLAPLVVRAYSDVTSSPDAEWKVQPGESVENTMILGPWTDRTIRGNLTPGYVDGNTIKLGFKGLNSNDLYLWNIWAEDLSYSVLTGGTYAEYMAALEAYGVYGKQYNNAATMTVSYGRIELLVSGTEWHTYDRGNAITVTSDTSTENGYICFDGERIGEINLESGEFSLNLGTFAREALSSSSNDTTIALQNSVVAMQYSASVPVLSDKKLSLSLGRADSGFVKEGKNRIVAFYDLDGNGAYTLGEPYGMVDDVDIGWYKASATLELTDTGRAGSRIDLVNDAADTAITYSNVTELTSNKQPYHKITETALGTGPTRVRVVRYAYTVDGLSWANLYGNGAGFAYTIFDRVIDPSVQTTLNEADLLGVDDYDIEWTKRSGFASTYASANSPVKVAYMIVFGDGTEYFTTRADTTQPTALNTVLVREYDGTWQKPEAKTPGINGSMGVLDASPTFTWSMTNDTYTAFILKVLNSAGTEIWNSGLQHTPVKNALGDYEYTPALYAGDLLEPGTSYQWQVSMYNTKFYTNRTDVAWSTANSFIVNTQTNGNSYGSIDVAAKYFGPSLVASNGVLRVEAFATPDFTGAPVARTYVRDMSTVNSTNAPAANATLIGLPAGKYYLRAWLDVTNSVAKGVSREIDYFEPWGYLSSRDGSTADMFRPVSVTVSSLAGEKTLAKLYIEDVDTNGNSLPDAWEMLVNNGSLYSTTTTIDTITSSGIMLNYTITGNLLTNQVGSAYSQVATMLTSTLSNAGVAALILNTTPAQLAATASGMTVDATADVSILGITATNGVVTLTAGASNGKYDTKKAATPLLAASSGSSTIVYTTTNAAQTPATKNLTATIYYSYDLSTWTAITQTVTIAVDNNGGTSIVGGEDFTVPASVTTGKEKCFFYIKIDE